jgi:hypothetical protein
MFGFKYGFAGSESEKAWRTTHTFDNLEDYEAFHINKRSDIANQAQSRLSDIQGRILKAVEKDPTGGPQIQAAANTGQRTFTAYIAQKIAQENAHSAASVTHPHFHYPYPPQPQYQNPGLVPHQGPQQGLGQQPSMSPQPYAPQPHLGQQSVVGHPYYPRPGLHSHPQQVPQPEPYFPPHDYPQQTYPGPQQQMLPQGGPDVAQMHKPQGVE